MIGSGNSKVGPVWALDPIRSDSLNPQYRTDRSKVGTRPVWTEIGPRSRSVPDVTGEVIYTTLKHEIPLHFENVTGYISYLLDLIVSCYISIILNLEISGNIGQSGPVFLSILTDSTSGLKN